MILIKIFHELISNRHQIILKTTTIKTKKKIRLFHHKVFISLRIKKLDNEISNIILKIKIIDFHLNKIKQ
jgi:hypothetical protein